MPFFSSEDALAVFVSAIQFLVLAVKEVSGLTPDYKTHHTRDVKIV